VLPHEVRVLERSSKSAFAIGTSTGRSSLRASCLRALSRWHSSRHPAPLTPGTLETQMETLVQRRFPGPTSAMNLGVSTKGLKHLDLIHIPVS
jgi:hypothetical protein